MGVSSRFILLPAGAFPHSSVVGGGGASEEEVVVEEEYEGGGRRRIIGDEGVVEAVY